jgi:hypothetical protein
MEWQLAFAVNRDDRDDGGGNFLHRVLPKMVTSNSLQMAIAVDH